MLKSHSVFLSNDIRGVYPTEINEQFARRLGWAIAANLNFKGKVIVSGDARESTPSLKQALCEGLNEMGINTFDIGTGPTPMLYYAVAKTEGSDLGIAVTASHNPPEFNGFKICDSNGVSLSYENYFHKLEKLIDKNKYYLIEHFSKSSWIRPPDPGSHKRNYDLPDVYFSFLKHVSEDISPIKVAVEYGNGCTGRFSETLPFKGIHIHKEPKGDFPVLNPDPTKEESFKYVKEKIQNGEADIGIVFDGDGDRVGFMGPDMQIISPDLVLMMFFDDLKTRNSYPSFVVDVKISKATSEYITQNGGKCKLSKVGHSYIQELVLKENIDVAGELSCHYYFNDEYLGFDDGLYSALRFLRIVSKFIQEGKSISEVISKYPRYHSSPEIRIKLPREHHSSIFHNLRKFARANYGKILEIDGIRVEFNDGWFLVRSSNTEAKLSYRIEAETEDRLKELRDKVEEIIKLHSD